MSTAPSPDENEPRGAAPDRAERDENGLYAAIYVPLTDVDLATGRRLLEALGRARIAAYLASPDQLGAARRRLFVAAEERADARGIVAATVRALHDIGTDAATDTHGEPATAPDPLAGIDTDAAFEALIADWHVDTHTAVRNAERDLRREDAEWRARLLRRAGHDTTADGTDDDADPVWLDDEHYVPPAPPPIPRPTLPTALGALVLAAGMILLIFGTALGLGGDFSVIGGIGAMIVGAGILFSRIRAVPTDDEDDDGATV